MQRDDTKRILAVHDLSAFGRCALTVIIPTLSVMGMQVVPLPTALLSTHTGDFYNMTFTDLSDTMMPALEHYKSLPIGFDAIYTGFLGSAGQIDTVTKTIEMFGEGALVLVDPVMGDDGKVYQTYTPEMCQRMRELCHKADIITPNLTEAYLLCDEEYNDTSKLSPDAALLEAERLGRKLTDTYGVKKLALTGVELSDDRIATLSCDKDSAERESVHIIHRIKNGYPGTGDLFASVLLGAMLGGDGFHDAVEFAGGVTAEMIADTSKYDTPRREGLRLEKNLYKLMKKGDFNV
ncbi:MAG: pyridoxamine kinase [Clostridia bacterium]|nr:pyridoxamine kinase [Clostridia bacterium]